MVLTTPVSYCEFIVLVHTLSYAIQLVEHVHHITDRCIWWTTGWHTGTILTVFTRNTMRTLGVAMMELLSTPVLMHTREQVCVLLHITIYTVTFFSPCTFLTLS